MALQTYLKKQEKISSEQSNLTSKGNRKRTTKKAQSAQKEGIIKMRAETNEIESKKIQKISETKYWFLKKK